MGEILIMIGLVSILMAPAIRNFVGEAWHSTPAKRLVGMGSHAFATVSRRAWISQEPPMGFVAVAPPREIVFLKTKRPGPGLHLSLIGIWWSRVAVAREQPQKSTVIRVRTRQTRFRWISLQPSEWATSIMWTPLLWVG